MPEPAATTERAITYSAALNEALREEMHRDPAVVLMGEDIAAWGEGGGVFGVSKGLVDEFGPQRVRDTPISEEAIVALGVGAAATGLRPVVELMYFDFVTLAMDPLVNQAAKLRYMSGGQAKVPLVVRSNIGASGGKAAQHSQSLESWLMHIPGLKVVVPSTPYDAKGLLKTAIRDDNPVVFLEHKLLYFSKGHVPEAEYLIPFGEAAIWRRGTDISVVATQAMLQRAVEAAEALAQEGIELEIIDPRTLSPLDIATIVDSVTRTNRLLICHEAVGRGGWAGEIALQVMEHAFDFLDAPIARVCAANVPVPYSAPLEDAVIPKTADIIAAARKLRHGEAMRETPTPARAERAPGATAEQKSGPAPPHPSLIPDVEQPGESHRVILPRVSDTMEEATISRWLKRPGDRIEKRDELVEVETDKITVILEAEHSGILGSVLVGDGEAAQVGSTLAHILS